LKAQFEVLSVAFVIFGLLALLGGADMIGVVLCGLGLGGIGSAAYSQ
jgi:hypothetical protein